MLAYIAAQDPTAASLVAERVFRMEQSISDFPFAARYEADSGTFDRYVPKTRIVLTYAITDDIIEIISVWHTSRDPESKPERT